MKIPKSLLSAAVCVASLVSFTAAGATLSYTEDTTVTEELVLAEATTIDVAAGVTATFSGGVSGAGALTKTGEGKLVLSGANTFTGALTADAGNILLSKVLSGSTQVVLGKGKITCGVATALGSAKVVWTAPEGTIDVYGKDTRILLGKDSTPALEKGATGYVVTNSVTTAPTVTLTNVVQSTSVYVRFAGRMTLKPNTKNLTLRNRRHDITGFTLGNTATVGLGTEIHGVTSYSAPSSALTLSVSSQEPDCFAELTSVTIGKSRLSLSAAVLNQFSRRGNIALVVSSGKASNAGLVLPTAASQWVVKSLKDGDGNTLSPGRYLASDYFKLTSSGSLYSRGYIVVEGGRDTASPKAITWAGETAGDFATQANWVDAESQALGDTDDLSSPANVYAATVTSGSSATLSKTMFLSKLQFGGDLAGFTLGTEGDTQALRIDGDGIVFAEKTDASAARTFDFYCPVILTSAAALNIPAGDTVIFHNGASVNANGFVASGEGTLSLGGGTNYIEGVITNRLTCLEASGVVKGDGMVVVNTKLASGSARKLRLNGCDFGATVCVPTAIDVTFTSTGAAGTTNIVRYLDSEASSTYWLSGDPVWLFDKLDAHGKITFRAPTGVYPLAIIRNATQGYREDGFFLANDAVHLILDASNVGRGRNLRVHTSSTIIELVRDDWFSATTAATTGQNDFWAESGVFNINATHQYCSCLYGGASVTGTVGSAIEIMSAATTNFTGVFRGAASLIMNGAGSETLTRKSVSTGYLTVKKGALVLADTASWKNAGAVNVLGGTLQLDGADPFDRDKTTLAVAGEGVVNLAGRVRFSSATVNGDSVAPGVYTVAAPGPFDGHLQGEGKLMVGQPGLTIFFR